MADNYAYAYDNRYYDYDDNGNLRYITKSYDYAFSDDNDIPEHTTYYNYNNANHLDGQSENRNASGQVTSFIRLTLDFQ